MAAIPVRRNFGGTVVGVPGVPVFIGKGKYRKDSWVFGAKTFLQVVFLPATTTKRARRPPPSLLIGVGKTAFIAVSPPSEPDRRISRIRLSSQWAPFRDSQTV